MQNGERTAEVNWIGTQLFSACVRWNMLWTLVQEKQPWNLAENSNDCGARLIAGEGFY